MVENTLKEREESYGKFSAGIIGIATIMKALNTIHKDKHGEDLSKIDEVTLNFMVIKLVRLGATPNHLDSWHDLQGYAKLGEDMYSAKDNK